MMSPGEGPGGILLAEGMANFSTLCLVEQVQGERYRQAMAKQIEAIYGEGRAVSSERPLNKTMNFRPGDETVIYDKGGWVFWMMRNLLGRQQMYAGLTSFIKQWHKGPDHPVLEDFVNHMRSYAPDAAAYDQFVDEWIFEVKMPEYRYMEKPEKKNVGGAWEIRAVIKNVGTAFMPVDVAATNGNRF
jgi:aminopeptidase N